MATKLLPPVWRVLLDPSPVLDLFPAWGDAVENACKAGVTCIAQPGQRAG